MAGTARQDLEIVLRAEISSLKRGLDKAEKEIKDLRQETTKLGKASDTAGRKGSTAFKKLGLSAKLAQGAIKTLGNVIKGVALQLAAFTAILSVGLIGRAVIGEIADFEDAVTQMGITLNKTGEDLALLAEAARIMGRETLFSASEAAEGLTALGQAGFTAVESVQAIEQVLDFAVATNLELATAAQKVTSVLNSFSLEATDAARVTDDRDAALQATAKQLGSYGRLVNYRRVLDIEGVDGPEDVAVIGNETEVESHLRELADAGATDFAAAITTVARDDAETVPRTRALLKSLIDKI